MRSTKPVIGFGLALVACALLGAFLLRGQNGLAGMALGLAGTLGNFLFGWMGIRVAGNAISAEKPQIAGFAVAFAFLMKLPLVVGCGMIAWRIGGNAPGCFIGGLLLVYCGALGWALLRK